ncbi:response regulator transcription factor [Tateyamaria pelophila]|uniref:response regulator transcription factor n=1 Tax=Tateyamaria pelophila TaxID=328415 RepID=UPI00295881ED|nr:response regulator transcription factor [Tateyamaria pelophila]
MKLAHLRIYAMRITLVEDNTSLAKGICYRLQDAGHAVDLLHDGLEAQSYLMSDGADMVILDINLPGVDGLTLLKEIRDRDDMRPVILLTARAETEDRVIGLDAGADDYLIKPFEMAELEARVRALLRRRAVPQQRMQSFGALSYDATGRQLFAGDVEIELPRREMSVFECLLGADGRLVSKNTMLDYAYGVGADVEETVVEVYVSRLRRRLGPHGVQIRSQRGLGYQLLLADDP